MDNLEFILYHESTGNEGPPSKDQVEPYPGSASAGDLVLQIDQNNSTNLVHPPASVDENEARILTDVHLVDARRDELFVAYEALKANGFLSVSTVGYTIAHEEAPGRLRELEEGEKASLNTLVDGSQAPSREHEDIFESLQNIEDPQERRTAKRLARNRLSAKRARERAQLRLRQLEFENRIVGEENRQLKRIAYFLFAKMRRSHA